MERLALQTGLLFYRTLLHNGKQGHKRDANEWGRWRREEVWEFRWGLIEKEGSLLFLYSIITSFLCQLSPLHCLLPLQCSLSLEYLFECLFSELKASLAIVSLLTHGHFNVYWVCGCQETWWFAKRICLCRGEGPWRVFKVSLHWDWSCSLRNNEHLKQTQVADLMDAVYRGP